MGRVIFGGAILVLGALTLLSNMGVIDNASEYFGSIFMIACGVMLLRVKGRFTSKSLAGLSFIVVGLILIGSIAGYYSVKFWDIFLPVLLVNVGLNILFFKKFSVFNVVNTNGERIEVEVDGINFPKKGAKKVLGEVRLGKTPFALDDLNYWLIAGEVRINLDNALIKEGQTNITIDGLAGSVVLYVPEDIKVRANVSLRVGELSLFGTKKSVAGMNEYYESEGYEEAARKININISLLAGDIKVKRVD